MPNDRSAIARALMMDYGSIEEARKASAKMMPGMKMRIRGALAEALKPGRSRGKGAPLSIRFLEEPT